MKRLLLVCLLLFLPASAIADGTVTVRVGNGIGDYDAAWDDFGNWGSGGETIQVTYVSYQMVYPDLDQLPGNNKTVTSAKTNIYVYGVPYCDVEKTLYFYEGEGRPTYTEVLWSYGPIYGELWEPESTEFGFKAIDMTTSLVQGWIDTPAGNEGFAVDDGGSSNSCPVSIYAIDNSTVEYRPYLEITYTYTGDIAPQKPYFTFTTWPLKQGEEIDLEWLFDEDRYIDPSTFTVQIDVKKVGDESWTTLTNTTSGDAYSYTWDTTAYDTGEYEVRIRSEASETVYSDWYTLDGYMTITSDDYKLVEVNNLYKVEKYESFDVSEPLGTPSWFAAKGEGEMLQLVLVPTRDLTDAEFSVGTFTKGGDTIPDTAVTVYVGDFIECTLDTNISGGGEGVAGFWTDILYPTKDSGVWNETRDASSIDAIDLFTNQPIFIDIQVPQGQAAGTYTGNLYIDAAEFSEDTIPLEFVVRTFAIPATSSLPNENYLSPQEVKAWHINNATYKDTVQQTEKELWQMYQDFFLEHRMSIDQGGGSAFKSMWDEDTQTIIPGDILVYDQWEDPHITGDPQTDRLVTGFALTAFFPRCEEAGDDCQDNGYGEYVVNPFTDEQMQQVWAWIGGVAETEGWDGAGMNYTWDEPHTWNFEEIGRRAENIKTASDIRTMVVSAPRIDSYEGGPTLLSQDEWIDIWVVPLGFLGRDGGTNMSIASIDDLNINNEVWTYQANGAAVNSNGMPSFHIDVTTGIVARILTWHTWLWDFEGLLYYHTNISWEGSDPFYDQYAFAANGDGTIVLPGTTGFIGGSHGTPVPTLRLKYIRDSFEDYEYFKLLDDAGYGDFVDSIVLQMMGGYDRDDIDPTGWYGDGVALAVYEYSRDVDLMASLRTQMADCLDGFGPCSSDPPPGSDARLFFDRAGQLRFNQSTGTTNFNQ
jgi:hypothetical protein